jgi:hypothetical protein
LLPAGRIWRVSLLAGRMTATIRGHRFIRSRP